MGRGGGAVIWCSLRPVGGFEVSGFWRRRGGIAYKQQFSSFPSIFGICVTGARGLPGLGRRGRSLFGQSVEGVGDAVLDVADCQVLG